MKTDVGFRLRSQAGLAFVAMDTIDAIADHVLGLLGTTRRVTRIQRYIYQGDKASPPSLDVQTGLRLSTDTRYENGINRWTQSNPVGKGLGVFLGNGFTGIGLAAYDYEVPTEEAAAARYHGKDGSVFNRRENVTVVRTSGTPGEPRLDDRIVIEAWNDHGVCVETTIAFEDTGPDSQTKDFARELLDVVDYGGDRTATYWSTDQVKRACQVLGLTVDQAKDGKRGYPRETRDGDPT